MGGVLVGTGAEEPAVVAVVPAATDAPTVPGGEHVGGSTGGHREACGAGGAVVGVGDPPASPVRGVVVESAGELGAFLLHDGGANAGRYPPPGQRCGKDRAARVDV